MSPTLQVMDRAAVLAALEAVNRWRPAALVGSAVATLLALLSVDPGGLAARPLVALLAVGVVLSGTGLDVLRAVFRNQRWLEDLPADRRLGRFDRAGLLALSERVHRALGVPDRRPVAITGDKDLNASVMMLGLGGFFPKLNAVYVHRPMLHVLDEAELATVLGHELGHYYRYKVNFVRDTLAHDALLLAVGLALVSRLDWGGAELFAVVFAQRGWFWVLGRLQGRFQHAIEYLCDEAGAEAGGWLPAVNAELKLGLEAETTLRLQQELLHEGGDVPAARLLALYEEALPFGREDPEDLRRRLRARLHQERQQRKGLSLRGYLDYLSGEDLDTRKELVRQLVPPVQTLDWDREALRRQGSLTEAQVETLIAQMRASPGRPLFQLPVEVGLEAATHPSHTRRVLYLWAYRGQIEARRAAAAP